MNKKLAAIFIAAAELYSAKRNRAANSGCCKAIGCAEKPGRESLDGCYALETEAQVLFRSLYNNHHLYYWVWPGTDCFESDRNARVLALLFAAEVARTGL